MVDKSEGKQDSPHVRHRNSCHVRKNVHTAGILEKEFFQGPWSSPEKYGDDVDIEVPEPKDPIHEMVRVAWSDFRAIFIDSWWDWSEQRFEFRKQIVKSFVQVLWEQEPRLLNPEFSFLEFDGLLGIRGVHLCDEVGRAMGCRWREKISLVDRVIALREKARQMEASGAMGAPHVGMLAFFEVVCQRRSPSEDTVLTEVGRIHTLAFVLVSSVPILRLTVPRAVNYRVTVRARLLWLSRLAQFMLDDMNERVT
jgi:hypothetical protein